MILKIERVRRSGPRSGEYELDTRDIVVDVIVIPDFGASYNFVNIDPPHSTNIKKDSGFQAWH